MRVLVCGSRHFNDLGLLTRVLDDLEIDELIEGGARGTDALARTYAEVLAIPVREFQADWNQFGKRAGPLRNIQMLKDGRPDLVVAFLAPDSKGTAHMIKIAKEAGVPVKIVNVS